jgi:hypothetical protein
MPTKRTENLTLLLEYLKVLTWPLLVIIALIIFSGSLRKLVSEQRVTKATFMGNSVELAPTGTKLTEASSSPGNPNAPDIWFSVRNVSQFRNMSCVEQGQAALRQSDFEQVQANGAGIAYGYQPGYVGAVNCGLLQPDRALISVAGPFAGLAEKHKKLDDTFVNGVLPSASAQPAR